LKFQQLKTDAAAIKARLASLRYTMLIGNSSITVAAYDGAPDYGAEIQADFEKFRQGAAADHIFKFNDSDQMNHIEAGVLERVARLFPEPFAELEAYVLRSASFLDPVVARFDREIQFYVATLVHIRRIGAAGLPFCYPKVSRQSKEENVSQCYDLALARKLADSDNKVVPNDYFLHGRERIIIVSGPNQGGKTTFARTFGQLHTLAALGCPVPAVSAQLFLFDRLFSHFEKGEDLHNLRGKLHDDLYRMHNTLASATSDSIVILNEVFNSTSLSDAIFLSTQILTRIIALDALCLCVTFIDELAALSDTTVSMASNVKPGDLARRTFKVTRRPPDGLAYAISVAEKYGLTYGQLRERLNP
jgi:DNA mismatch repair protein MutS